MFLAEIIVKVTIQIRKHICVVCYDIFFDHVDLTDILIILKILTMKKIFWKDPLNCIDVGILLTRITFILNDLFIGESYDSEHSEFTHAFKSISVFRIFQVTFSTLYP